MKNKNTILQSTAKKLFSWIDVFLLLSGMTFIIIGVFLIYRPAGYIVWGLCFIALAFFVANKQAGGDS
jgi:hypothetical protein